MRLRDFAGAAEPWTPDSARLARLVRGVSVCEGKPEALADLRFFIVRQWPREAYLGRPMSSGHYLAGLYLDDDRTILIHAADKYADMTLAHELAHAAYHDRKTNPIVESLAVACAAMTLTR
jgi:hypothetical protein